MSAETWDGSVRVWLEADGTFSVQISDKFGGNGYTLSGNVNSRERYVEDHAGVLFDQRPAEVDA